MNENRLFIRNIDRQTTEEDLERIFSSCGDVDRIRVRSERGIVDMLSVSQARRARHKLNGLILWGRSIEGPVTKGDAPESALPYDRQDLRIVRASSGIIPPGRRRSSLSSGPFSGVVIRYRTYRPEGLGDVFEHRYAPFSVELPRFSYDTRDIEGLFFLLVLREHDDDGLP